MIRILGYVWASPVTLLGLLLAGLAACTGGRVGVRGGVIEAHGGLVRRLLRGSRLRSGGAALALGHVVLARDRACLERSRDHELAHVRQYERWGPLLLPAYWLAGRWLAARGYDPHLDNPFERQACAEVARK